MARTDKDELWEKQSDGKMKLMSSVDRAVSDKEMERESIPELLKELQDKTVWNAIDLEQAVRLLLRHSIDANDLD